MLSFTDNLQVFADIPVSVLCLSVDLYSAWVPCLRVWVRYIKIQPAPDRPNLCPPLVVGDFIMSSHLIRGCVDVDSNVHDFSTAIS